jgi:hypothetical protein
MPANIDYHAVIPCLFVITAHPGAAVLLTSIHCTSGTAASQEVKYATVYVQASTTHLVGDQHENSADGGGGYSLEGKASLNLSQWRCCLQTDPKNPWTDRYMARKHN